MLSLFETLRYQLAPPVFPGDEEKTRRADVLNSILLSMLAVTLLATVALVFFFPEKVGSGLVIAALLAVGLISQALMRRGHLRLAGLVCIGGQWCLVTGLVATAGGMQSIDAIYYLMVTVFAGLVLGTDMALGVVALTALAGLGMVGLQVAGRLPHLFPLPPFSGLLNLSFGLFLAAMALRVALRSLDRALAQARQEVRERQQAEAALRESEQQFRLLAENSTDLIARHAPDGTYRYASPACRRLLGYAPAELLGQSAYPFIHPDDAAQVVLVHRALAHYQLAAPMSYRLRRQDGAYVWVESTFQAVLDAAGGVGEIYAVSRDMTERKRADELIRAQYRQLQAQHAQLQAQEQALRQAEAELRQANAALEQRVAERTAQLEQSVKDLEAFTYSISHDLRTPLRAISGFTRFLDDDYRSQLPPEAGRLVGRVRASADHMNELIDDLLAFSRLGRRPVQKRLVAMESAVQQALDELRADYGARVEAVHLGPLPPAQADAHLLHQVLVNLLSNALKFTRQQSAPRIEVGCEQRDAELVYYVRDNGVGFDMAYAQRLFSVFQRLHPAQEYEGTGVGLAIVQLIVRRHEGRVWAEAAVDQGATFYFTLPPAPASHL